jgi:hypothetical protein
MHHDTFTLTPTAPLISNGLGYLARAVQVDNYTAQFVRIDGASRDIPPFAFGVVVPLDGTQIAAAMLIAAPQAPYAAVPPSSAATLTYYAESLPPDSGHVLAITPQNQRTALYPDGTPSALMGLAPLFPSFTVPLNGSVTKTFTLLPTETNIRVMVVGSTTFRVQVVGHQTGVGYEPSSLVATNASSSPFRPIDVRVEPSWDSQVDITVSDQNTFASNVYVNTLVGAETTSIAGQLSAVIVQPIDNSTTAPPLNIVNRPYDWQVQGTFAAASTPSLTSPFITGARLILASYVASIGSFGAVAAQAVNVTIKTSSAQTMWQDTLSFPAVAGSADHARMSGLALPSQPGESMTMSFNGPIGANSFAALSMGGYFSN